MIDYPQTPVSHVDDTLLKITPLEPQTVGCVFGSIVTIPDVRHQNESTEEFCTECGYHHLPGVHEIPLDQAVEECKRIAENLP